jgi:hypothetical protein
MVGKNSEIYLLENFEFINNIILNGKNKIIIIRNPKINLFSYLGFGAAGILFSKSNVENL